MIAGWQWTCHAICFQKCLAPQIGLSLTGFCSMTQDVSIRGIPKGMHVAFDCAKNPTLCSLVFKTQSATLIGCCGVNAAQLYGLCVPSSASPFGIYCPPALLASQRTVTGITELLRQHWEQVNKPSGYRDIVAFHCCQFVQEWNII